MSLTQPILILSESPIEQIWSYLSLWEGETAARRLIDDRADRADVKLRDGVESKARSVAYCLRNARECFQQDNAAWIPRVVSRYYGSMWLLGAIMASDPSSKYDLDELEKVTKFGHGLGNVASERADFPFGEFIYLRESGFLPAFLKYEGWSKRDLANRRPINQRIENLSELTPEDARKLIGFSDLLKRIPEISSHFIEITGLLPMSARVFQYRKTNQHGVDYLGVIPAREVSLDELLEFQLPIEDFELTHDGGHPYWTGKFNYDTKYWWQSIDLHQSAMAPTSWIAPLPRFPAKYMVINVMILYTLSILTRYRPGTWREVLEGRYDSFRPLLSIYLQVAERVLPELALERVSGRRVSAVQPGSLFAPV